MRSPKKNILVTGGAGYIGSQFSYDAIDKNYKVIIVDNLSTGKIKLLPRKATFYKCNISNLKKIDFILKKHKINNVIHFAASTNVEESNLNPTKYYKNNSIATEKLIHICVKNNVKKFIFSSTCAVYGDVNYRVNEDSKCFPKNHYGMSKLLSEVILRNSHKENNFSLGILRYFNVIGADKKLRTGLINNNGSLVKNLVNKIFSKDKTINIFGNDYNTKDKTCIREFIDINDISKIHLDVLKKLNKGQSIILNCSYNKSYSVLELINKFEKVSDIKLKKVFLNRRKGDIKSMQSNNKNLYKFLKKKYNTNLNQSLKKSLEWYKKIKN
tara:strand:- start:3387 stop:4367 length:981 start_codon:yes stop_codon:yes gene_type:complete